MNKPDTAQPKNKNGFIRIIVTLIILLFVFTFAGFNLQESFTVDSLLSTISQLWEQLKLFYLDQLQTPLHHYVGDPMKVLYDILNRHIISEITTFVEKIIHNEPIW